MGDEVFLRAVRAGVAVLLCVAWVAIVVIGVVYSFGSGEPPSWVESDGLKYFIPGLTALLGGVVATVFGVTPTDNSPSGTVRLGNLVEARSLDEKAPAGARIWVGRVYVLAYLVLGAVAAFTWCVKGGHTVEYISTLAPAWGGLVLPIGTSFVGQS